MPEQHLPTWIIWALIGFISFTWIFIVLPLIVALYRKNSNTLLSLNKSIERLEKAISVHVKDLGLKIETMTDKLFDSIANEREHRLETEKAVQEKIHYLEKMFNEKLSLLELAMEGIRSTCLERGKVIQRLEKLKDSFSKEKGEEQNG